MFYTTEKVNVLCIKIDNMTVIESPLAREIVSSKLHFNSDSDVINRNNELSGVTLTPSISNNTKTRSAKVRQEIPDSWEELVISYL